MAEPVLQLTDLVKDYPGVEITRVLHGLSLTLMPGEFTALIGPSGSGKSTLLNLIGLLDRPTAGSIRLAGQETTGLDDDALAHLRATNLGFIFQFHHLLPAFTAEENVAMPMAAAKGRMTDHALERARALLEEVGMGELAKKRANKLSGGQQQRVAIARALVMRPPLVLADEPTGNLDTHTSDQTFALMRKVNQEFGTTFLVVTHDPQLAARCDRIVEIVDGQLVRDEPVR